MALITCILLVHLPVLNSIIQNWSVDPLTLSVKTPINGKMESQIVIISISFLPRKSFICCQTKGQYKTLLPCFIEIPVFNGNNMASDLV